jgi:hypothetical protein
MNRQSKALILAMSLLFAVGIGIYVSSLDVLKSLRWDFIGSLIGAAGTIFAGWLAFSAVQEQNRLSQEAALRSARLQAKNDAYREEEKRKVASDQIVALKRFHRFLGDIIEPFDAVSSTSTPDVVHLRGLEQLERTKGMVAPTIPGLPPEMQYLAQSTWWRLFGIYESYDKWKKERPDPAMRGKTERDSFNASIGEAVSAMREARDKVAAAIG